MESHAERYFGPRPLLHPSFKVPSIRAFPPDTRFPLVKRGPYRKRWPYPVTFLTYLPRSPVKELPTSEDPSTEPLQREKLHPQSHFNPSLKVPGRRVLLQFPQTGPLWKEIPDSGVFSIYPSGSPEREPSFQVPFTELPKRERHSNSRAPFNHISKSSVYKPTPGYPAESHEERCPSLEPSWHNL